jgi:hypothetical protein
MCSNREQSQIHNQLTSFLKVIKIVKDGGLIEKISNLLLKHM